MSRVQINVSQEDLKILDAAAVAGRMSREAVAASAFSLGLTAAKSRAEQHGADQARVEAKAREEASEVELEKARAIVKAADAKKKAADAKKAAK